jgi:hypothetical protein
MIAGLIALVTWLMPAPNEDRHSKGSPRDGITLKLLFGVDHSLVLTGDTKVS